MPARARPGWERSPRGRRQVLESGRSSFPGQPVVQALSAPACSGGASLSGLAAGNPLQHLIGVIPTGIILHGRISGPRRELQAGHPQPSLKSDLQSCLWLSVLPSAFSVFVLRPMSCARRVPEGGSQDLRGALSSNPTLPSCGPSSAAPSVLPGKPTSPCISVRGRTQPGIHQGQV